MSVLVFNSISHEFAALTHVRYQVDYEKRNARSPRNHVFVSELLTSKSRLNSRSKSECVAFYSWG